jgi:hypothetical protein
MATLELPDVRCVCRHARRERVAVSPSPPGSPRRIQRVLTQVAPRRRLASSWVRRASTEPTARGAFERWCAELGASSLESLPRLRMWRPARLWRAPRSPAPTVASPSTSHTTSTAARVVMTTPVRLAATRASTGSRRPAARARCSFAGRLHPPSLRTGPESPTSVPGPGFGWRVSMAPSRNAFSSAGGRPRSRPTATSSCWCAATRATWQPRRSRRSISTG